MKNKNIELNNHWSTPPKEYNDLNSVFNFNFDPFPYQHDLSKWDGLKVNWKERNFVNPPYEQKIKDAAVVKAVEEKEKGNLSVLLLPASLSTILFHDVIVPNCEAIYSFRRRLNFIGINSKGQYVNYHLLGRTTEELIEFDGKMIKKYVRNSGQTDSILVIMSKRARFFPINRSIKKIDYLTRIK